MPEIFIRLIEATAWPMAAPKPYSPFHLLLTAAGLAAALLSAIALGKSFRKKTQKELEKSSRRLLFACSLVLMFMEAYKQCFLFYLNGFHYNWWYFPFQLCSVPMYLCLSFPLIKKAERRTVLASFLQDFGVLGAVFALAYPPGLMYPYWTLTLHSFIWHFLLFFIGTFCAVSGLSDRSSSGWRKELPLFFACCAAALAINTAAGPEANADMFYISPYHPSVQPVFRQIAETLGIFPGILIYLAAVLAGSRLTHKIWEQFKF